MTGQPVSERRQAGKQDTRKYPAWACTRLQTFPNPSHDDLQQLLADPGYSKEIHSAESKHETYGLDPYWMECGNSAGRRPAIAIFRSASCCLSKRRRRIEAIAAVMKKRKPTYRGR
jgi:hypothetical protein